MKRILLFLIVFVFYSKGTAQNLIYVGNKKFESTETWGFSINGTCWDSNKSLDVTIGKTSTGGILMLSTGVPFEYNYIGGNIYVFLSDGSKITCLDKKVKDHVDDKAIAVYYLTNAEVERLKNYHIDSIRFTIQPSDGGGFFGNKTASNYVQRYLGSNEIDYIETNLQISELFDE